MPIIIPCLEDPASASTDERDEHLMLGEKPHVNVHVDLQAVAGLGGGLHETDDGHVLDVETVNQINCDASISRIVFGPDCDVLDVGRKTRVVPAALRRAVVARDRHCVIPDCTRPAKWSDVHHRVAWAHGGETEINNLCLLCRHHHTLVHLELAELPNHQELVARRPT